MGTCKARVLILLILLVVGCVTDPPRPLHQPSGCAIGILVRFPARFRIFAPTPSWAYFVRLDEAGTPSRSEPIRSNERSFRHSTGDYYIYLVDTEPGRYAPIAVGYTHDKTSHYTTYLPQSAIDDLAVTVGGDAGDIGFIGEVALERSKDWETADETQLHYYRATGYPEKSLFMKWLTGGTHYVGAVTDVLRSEKAKERFLRHRLWEDRLINYIRGYSPQPLDRSREACSGRTE